MIVEMVRRLAGLGMGVDNAASEGDWPWDVDERIHNAVKRGYEALLTDARGA